MGSLRVYKCMDQDQDLIYRAGLGLVLRAWLWLSSGMAFNFASPSPEPKPIRFGLKPGLVDMFGNIVSKTRFVSINASCEAY